MVWNTNLKVQLEITCDQKLKLLVQLDNFRRLNKCKYLFIKLQYLNYKEYQINNQQLIELID